MMRVLIVDDDPSSARLLRGWIEAEGASTMEAVSAEGALALIGEEGVPAAAFCEVRLPGKNGLWLADHLRAEHPHTAVIMTTSQLDVPLAVSSLHVGAVDHLVKPLVHDRVAAALKRAFDAHTFRRSIAAMQEELEGQRRQITQAFADIERSVATSLEAVLAMRQPRDPASLARIHGVARLAVNLALTLEVGEPQLSHIERAVFLQDLGPLPTPDEQRCLEILRGAPLLAEATEIALAAHERYDGSGFPRGLRGDQIPLGARIIAVAAACAELMSVGQLTPAQVVGIVCSEGASTFDPFVLGALKRLYSTEDLESPLPVGGTRDPIRLIHGASHERQQGRDAHMTDAGSAGNDPRRRWIRKRLATGVSASISGKPARLVDISYGGFRIEMPDWLDASRADTVAVNVPEFQLQAEATCKWKTRLGTSGPYWCGVALTDDETRAGSRWRAVVDTLQPEFPMSPDLN